MMGKTKREIRNKTRLAYCLVDILEYGIDNLKNEAHDCDHNTLMETVQKTKTILQNIVDIITELEYILYLEKLK